MLTRKFYLGIFIFLFMVGCNNPDSQPELKDPVFQDIKSEIIKVEKEKAALLKELEEHKATYGDLPDSDNQKKVSRGDIFKVKNEISKLDQKLSFYKISAESRKIYARKEYLSYFKQGKQKEWPPAHIKVLYDKQKITAAAPKQWIRGIAKEKLQPKEEKNPTQSSH